MLILTYHWLNTGLHYTDKLMIYTNRKITKYLPIFGQVKVDQIVLILLRCVVLHEFLKVNCSIINVWQLRSQTNYTFIKLVQNF